eukprot:5792258-Pyramimonas_sp.AAC.1
MHSSFAKFKKGINIKSWCSLFLVVNFVSVAMAAKAVNPWISLLKSNMRKNPSAGYVTLATVENARPRARTVLFSGCVSKPINGPQAIS